MNRLEQLAEAAGRVTAARAARDEAVVKLMEADRGLEAILTPWERRRVSWLRLNLNSCREKVGFTLAWRRGWMKSWDEASGRFMVTLSYDKLPFYFRVLAHYFDYAEVRSPDGKDITIFHFDRDRIIKNP